MQIKKWLLACGNEYLERKTVIFNRKTIFIPDLTYLINFKKFFLPKLINRLISIGLVIFLFIQSPAYAQEKINDEDSVRLAMEDSVKLAQTVDLFDVLRGMSKKEKKPRDLKAEEGVKSRSLLPIIGYAPANGFVIGAALSITEYLGNPKTTKLSSALANVSFTTKDQTLINFRSDLYLKDNKWYIPGDIRLLLFTQPTYGLGIYGLKDQTYDININGLSASKSVSQQPMRFNYVRIYETVARKVRDHFYIGIGINIDYDYSIKDDSLNLDSANLHLTSHYIYSTTYGFNTSHYSANGFSLKFIYDSRDNPINPYIGYYGTATFRMNREFLGSSQNSLMASYDLRTYLSLSKTNPRKVIGFWTLGTFTGTGKMPYLTLPSITWDTYNRSGRGYIQGRFRGTNMMYGETEYRFPISKKGLLGGVAFVNVTTASNPLTGQPLFSSLAPGYGAGLRIMMNKKDRTNICVDYGIGAGFTGIYFNIREAF